MANSFRLLFHRHNVLDSPKGFQMCVHIISFPTLRLSETLSEAEQNGSVSLNAPSRNHGLSPLSRAA